MTATGDIVAKLWNLCHVLRDGGISYQQYVTELTLLLFLKMEEEVAATRRPPKTRLPEKLRWTDLENAPPGGQQLDHYKRMLLDLGKASDPLVRAIYTGAQTSLREARHLSRLVVDIDALDWFTAKQDGLGDLYEGLLEKNAGEIKSGAGQYFTPRPLIDAMVEVMRPQPGEVIQDPAAGTGGFLIAADTYIKRHTDDLFDLDERAQEFQRKQAFVGLELVPETRRLALMNCMLHDIEGTGDGPVRLGDSLTGEGAKLLGKANVILSNPPFGTKKGAGGGSRDDLTFQTSNKQLMFLQHIYKALVAGGRAAVVLPDNVLFEEGRGREIRADLMDKCDLHTILRLPTGIFYAQGVKTNVLFFTRGRTEKGNTKQVWVYDLRTNAPAFGKRTPFTRAYLQPFVDAYGPDPLGTSPRKDEGETGRFRAFSRADIARRNDNLDITWLKDDDAHDESTLGDPAELAATIRTELEAALADLASLEDLLGSTSAGA